MPKIRIIYDAENGGLSRDGDAEKIVDALLSEANNVEYTTSNSTVVYAMRLAVKQNRISHEDVMFIFNQEEIPVLSNAQLTHWPNGFCDHTMKFLAVLARRNS